MTEHSQAAPTAAELIRLELEGKKVALGRYDTILWQVRSGFVIVLYGALGLLFKDGLSLKDLSDQIIILVCGFSVLAYCMDLVFRIRQPQGKRPSRRQHRRDRSPVPRNAE